jgi:hypothetical protein
VRRNDLNETVYPEALADQPPQAMGKFSLAGRIPLAPLHDHGRHLNPIRVQYRKRTRVARSHLGQFLSEMLQILSPDFSAIDNDDIFLPANDHNPTFGEIANVLGVKPSVRGQDLTSFLGIVKVPRHNIGASQKNYAGVAIR